MTSSPIDMRFSLSILSLFCCIYIHAQQIVQPEDSVISLRRVGLSAQFPRGESGWQKFVERTIDLNKITNALADSIKEVSERITVSFIITKKGEIDKPQIAAPENSAYAEAILDVLKKSPLWQPEIQGSGPVKSFVHYYFIFVIVADMASVTVKRFYTKG